MANESTQNTSSLPGLVAQAQADMAARGAQAQAAYDKSAHPTIDYSAAIDGLTLAQRGLDDYAYSIAKNGISGAVSGVLDTAGGIATFADWAGMPGANSVAKALAAASQSVQNASDNMGSAAEKAAQRQYNDLQEITRARRAQERAGKESSFETMMEDMSDSFMNAWKSGHWVKGASEGAGELLVQGGLGGVAKAGASKLIGSFSTGQKVLNGLKAAEASKNILTKYGAKAISGNSGFAVMGGFEELGASGAQIRQNILNTSPEDLMKTSPEYVANVKELVANGMTLDEAMIEAKENLATNEAFKVGGKAALATMVTDMITGGIETKGLVGLRNSFKAMDDSLKASRATKQITEEAAEEAYRSNKHDLIKQALLGGVTNPITEGATEGYSQYVQNESKKEHIKHDQDLWEGVGESAAQGMLGGLGASSMQGAATIPAVFSGYSEDDNDMQQSSPDSSTASSGSDPATPTPTPSVNASQPFTKDTATKSFDRAITDSQDANTVANLQEIHDNYVDYVDDTKKVDPTTFDDKDFFEKAESVVGYVDSSNLSDDDKNNLLLTMTNIAEKAEASIEAKRANYQAGTPLTADEVEREANNIYLKNALDLDADDYIYNLASNGTLDNDQLIQVRDYLNDHRDSFKLGTAASDAALLVNSHLSSGSKSVINSVSLSSQTPTSASDVQATIPDATNKDLFTLKMADGNDWSFDGNTGTVTRTADGASFTLTSDEADNALKGLQSKIPSTQAAARKSLSDAIQKAFTTSSPAAQASNVAPDSTGAMATADIGGSPFIILENMLHDQQNKTASYPVPQQYQQALKTALANQDTTAIQNLLNNDILPQVFPGQAAIPALAPKNPNIGKIAFSDGSTRSIDLTAKTITNDANPQDVINLSDADVNDLKAMEAKGDTKGIARKVATLLGGLSRSSKSLVNYRGQKVYMPDGSIEYRATANHAKPFKDNFGDSIGKIGRLMFRPIRSLTSKTPLEDTFNFLTDTTKLETAIRADNPTNAGALLKRLYGNKKAHELKLDRGAVSPTQTALENLTAMLDPKGAFQQKVEDALSQKKIFQISADMPQIFKDTFTDPTTGELKPEIIQLLRMSLPHLISVADAFTHDMTEDEMKRYGFTPGQVVTSDISDIIIRNFGTELRKIAQVSKTNNISQADFDLAFNTLGVVAADALVSMDVLSIDKVSYNVNSIDGTIAEQEFTTLSLTEDENGDSPYKRMFGSTATIFTQIFDPSTSNVVSLKPLEVNPIIRNTNTKVTTQVAKALQTESERPGFLNQRDMKLQVLMGGAENIAKHTLGYVDSFVASSERNQEHQKALKGRAVTQRLAYDFTRETLITMEAEGKDPSNTPVFFQTQALVNGRMMQVGAATPQANREMRRGVKYANNDPVNLNVKKNHEIFVATVAQNLGIKITDKKFADYEGTVTDIFNALENIVTPISTSQVEIQKAIKLHKAAIDDFTRLQGIAQQGIDSLENWIQSLPPGTPVPFTEAEALNKARGTVAWYRNAIDRETALLDYKLSLAASNRTISPYAKFLDDFLKLDPMDLVHKTPEELYKQSQKQRDTFFDLMDALNAELKKKGIDVQLNKHNMDDMAVLIEMLRYNQAKKSNKLNKYECDLTLEIDGVNDGPSYIASIFGIAMGGLTGDLIRKMIRTGNFIGLKTSNDEVQTPGSEAAEVTGTKGKDFHAEVAKEQITSNILTRIIRTRQDTRELRDTDPTNHFVTAMAGMFMLFDNMGLIEWKRAQHPSGSSIDEYRQFILDLKESDLDINNLPVAFSRDVSKVMTTIVPYGSEVRGATNNILTEMLKGKKFGTSIYEIIDKNIGFHYQKDTTSPEAIQAKQQLNNIKTAFITLLTHQPDKDGRYSKFDTIPKEINNLLDLMTKMPTDDPSKYAHRTCKGIPPRVVFSKKVRTFGIWVTTEPDDSKHPDYIILPKKKLTFIPFWDARSFKASPEMMNKMVWSLMPTFGEPAHAAVNNVLGTKAMRGGKLATVAASTAAGIRQYIEQSLLFNPDGTKKKLDARQEKLVQKAIESLAFVVKLNCGVKMVVGETGPKITGKALYTSKSGLVVRDSTMVQQDVGVAGGAIITQGSGDGVTQFFGAEALANKGINTTQVFDGNQVGIADGMNASELLNEASTKAQEQLVIGAVAQAFERIGEVLTSNPAFTQTFPEFAGKDPMEAMGIAYTKYLASLPKAEADYRGNQYIRLVQSVLGDREFIPSLIKYAEASRRNNHVPLSNIAKEENTQRHITNACRDFVKVLGLASIDEKIKKKIIFNLPRSTHHIGNLPNAVATKGKPLTIKQAKALLKAVNKMVGPRKDGSPMFRDYSEMMDAFINSMAYKLYQADHSGDKERDKAYVDFIGASPNRVTGISFLDDSVLRHIEKAFGTNIMSAFANPPPKERSKVLKKGDALNAIQDAFDSYGKTGYAGVFGKILKAVRATVPANTKIVLGTMGTFPPEIQKYFKADTKREAMFVQDSNGPVIYLIDQGASLDITNKKNRANLIHEAIHAALSLRLKDLYANRSKYPKETQDSLKLLEDLIDEFLQHKDITNQTDVIEGLKKILDGLQGAERIDEALAYILSNKDLMEAAARIKLADARAEGFKNELSNILRGMLSTAKDLFWSLLGFVYKSPKLKEMLASQDPNKFSPDHMRKDFISLFGATTYCLIDSSASLNPPPTSGNTPLTRAAKSIGESSFFNLPSQHKATILSAVRDITKSKQVEASLKQATDLEMAIAGALTSVLPTKELTDAVTTIASLCSANWVDATNRSKAQMALDQLIKGIDEKSFVINKTSPSADDLERSKAIYQLLVEPEKIKDIKDFIDSLHKKDSKGKVTIPVTYKDISLMSALVLATVADDIDNVLGKVTYKEKKESVKLIHPIDAINNTIINAFNKDMKDSLNGQSLGDIGEQVLKESQKKIKTDPVTAVFGKAEDVTSTLMSKVYTKLTGGKPIEFNKDAPKNALKMKAYNWAAEELKHKANSAPTKIAQIISDILPVTDSDSGSRALLKKVKGYQTRITNIATKGLAKALEKAFKTKITPALKKNMHKWLLKGSLYNLDLTEVEKALKSKTEIGKEIANIKQELDKLGSSAITAVYENKIKQLVNYNLGTREPGTNLLKNSYTITSLLGERNVPAFPDGFEHRLKDIEPYIAKWIAYESLNALPQREFRDLRDLYNKDKDAVDALLDNIKHLKKLELSDAKKWHKAIFMARQNGFSGIFNASTDFTGSGTLPKGEYAIVSAKDRKEFEKSGFKVLGEYTPAKGEKTEGKLYRMYCKYPMTDAYKEAILQSIQATSFGVRLVSGKSTPHQGLRMDKGSIGDIPVFSPNGDIVGYERAIPKEDLEQIEKFDDIFTAIASLNDRKYRESMAGQINERALKLLKDQYDNASKEAQKKEYVDVLSMKDPTIKDALERLPPELIENAQKIFNGKFYIRKDELNRYLGYRQATIADLWKNNSILPKGVEEGIIAFAEALLGKRAMYYLNQAEKVWMGAVGWTKDTIVVRSGIIPLYNTIANVLLLHYAVGIPFNEIFRIGKETIQQTKRLERIEARMRELKQERVTSHDKSKIQEIDKEYSALKNELRNLPIYTLYKDGEFSNIAPEGHISEDMSMFLQDPDSLFGSLINKLDPQKKDFLSNVFMTKNSDAFKAMSQVVTYGDWVGKVITYRYLTSPRSGIQNMMSESDARRVASTMFIDFDQPIARSLDWVNRMGLAWFMTYKVRLIPAAILGMMLNPSKVLLASILDTSTIDVGTLLTENAISRLFGGSIFNSLGPGMIFHGLALHPTHTVLSVV